ncbi:MAG: hypothetical protein ACXVPU_13225, partial [Bacteroidia bacterium]
PLNEGFFVGLKIKPNAVGYAGIKEKGILNGGIYIEIICLGFGTVVVHFWAVTNSSAKIKKGYKALGKVIFNKYFCFYF